VIALVEKKKEASVPLMQDLSDGASLIARAFRRLSAPLGRYNFDGDWTHLYHEMETFGWDQVQGGLSLTHHANGLLRIEGFRYCPDGYCYFTTAEMQGGGDLLRAPTSWRVSSKVSQTVEGTPILNSGMTKRVEVNGGGLLVEEGNRRRTVEAQGPYLCKRGLLDVVGRIRMLGMDELHFTLVDEYDEVCPGQTIRFCGTRNAETRSGTIEVSCYQHTGIGTIPGVYYVDAVGRVLFCISGMEMMVLASVDGTETGYLQ